MEEWDASPLLVFPVALAILKRSRLPLEHTARYSYSNASKHQGQKVQEAGKGHNPHEITGLGQVERLGSCLGSAWPPLLGLTWAVIQ